YTPMAQYRGDYQRIVNAVFEHDIYFQSIGRGLGHMVGKVDEVKARIEYLRALRYELGVLPGFDQVQVCTPANRDYLLGFRPGLGRGLRARPRAGSPRSEEHTSELQSRRDLVCRLLLEKKKTKNTKTG